MDSTPATEQAILFRPSKKRKIYRQRGDDDEDPQNNAVSAAAPPAAQSLDELIASGSNENSLTAGEVEGATVSMAEILRLRRFKEKRSGGVKFRAANGAIGLHEEEKGLVVRQKEEGDEEVKEGANEGGLGVVRRFAPQTGMVTGDVDRHMMAYVDSELAKRRSASLIANAAQSTASPASRSTTTTGTTSGNVEKGIDHVQRQPATLGKLLEIDLGEEARERNVERTEQARRKLDGSGPEDEETERGGGRNKNAKTRLGPDGQPWRSRKKRRGSDDVKRDKMVEDVLRENRLEIYDELPPTPPPMTGDDHGAADDAVAEAFRREFMDAVSQRQRKKIVPEAKQTRGQGGKMQEEEIKGPKLGGSRNARAAMRERLLKESKGKK